MAIRRESGGRSGGPHGSQSGATANVISLCSTVHPYCYGASYAKPDWEGRQSKQRTPNPVLISTFQPNPSKCINFPSTTPRSGLDIFIAEIIPLDVQHVRNRLVGRVAKHVEHVAKRGLGARVAVGASGSPKKTRREASAGRQITLLSWAVEAAELSVKPRGILTSCPAAEG